MHTFNLWNPYLISEIEQFEFEATEANFSGLNEGTYEWINQSLQMFGVTTSFDSWEIIPIRSVYFSDYAEDPIWQNRWTAGWSVRCQLAGLPKNYSNNLFEVPVYAEALDATWNLSIGEGTISKVDTLIVSDFRLPIKDITKVQNQLNNQKQVFDGFSIGTDVALRTFHCGVTQLRLKIKSCVFPEHVQLLESILQMLKDSGGATNWRERFLW